MYTAVCSCFHGQMFSANFMWLHATPHTGCFILKTAFIFGYNSHNNGPICIKFAANVPQRMQILLTLDFVEYTEWSKKSDNPVLILR